MSNNRNYHKFVCNCIYLSKNLYILQTVYHRVTNTVNYVYAVGAKIMSPVDIELLFVILYNIITIYHNGNQVIQTSNYIILVFTILNHSF